MVRHIRTDHFSMASHTKTRAVQVSDRTHDTNVLLPGAPQRPAAAHRQRFAGGPLLLPGSPLTFAGSWCCTEESPAGPTVPCPALGPVLPPGAPLIPAPEFCELVAVSTPPVPGWPGGSEDAPGVSWLPTFPEAPELCVLMPYLLRFEDSGWGSLAGPQLGLRLGQRRRVQLLVSS